MTDLSSIGGFSHYRINAIAGMRKSIDQMQSELATGRKSDLALQLGSALNPAYEMRSQLQLNQVYRQNATKATNDLGMIDAALLQVQDGIANVKSLLISAKAGAAPPDDLRKAAETALNDLIRAAAVTSGDRFQLSGEQSDQPPIAAYRQDPTSPARTAFEQAFLAASGQMPGPAALSALTAAQFDSLSANYSPDGVSASDWETNWISGSPSSRLVIVDATETLEMPKVDANSSLRQVAGAYVLLSEIAQGGLMPDVYDALINASLSLLGQGEAKLQSERTNIGHLTQRLEQYGANLDSAKVSLTTQIGEIENVDAYEISVKLNEQQIILEMSYTLTARLNSLFLANYL